MLIKSLAGIKNNSDGSPENSLKDTERMHDFGNLAHKMNTRPQPKEVARIIMFFEPDTVVRV